MHEDSTHSRQKALISRIGPAVLFICLLLDLALRLLPPRLFAFRAWESMTLFAVGNKAFVPNTVYRNTRSSGDLSHFANLPELRQFREEVFSTDAAGYRNRRATPKPFTGIVLVGDSFTAGSGISDEFTLGEQLNRISGLNVYNGGGTKDFWGLVGSLQIGSGLVIWQVPERLPTPLSTVFYEQNRKSSFADKVLGEERAEALREMREYESKVRAYSPLEILSGRAVKSLQNDKIFPNPYRDVVLEAELRNGRDMLFLGSDVQNYYLDRPADPAALAQIKMQLEKKGIGLLVLLVPDKYTVYHDLIVSPSVPAVRQEFFDIAEQRLAAANVPVLNLTQRFRKRAEVLLSQDEYLYWLDDTHWNAEGIREAAQAIADSKTVSECPCRPKDNNGAKALN